MSKKSVKVIISGKVQGVSFRYYTYRKALSLLLNGYVRNLSTGEVEAEFEGEEENINEMLEWCYEGSPNSLVRNVEVFHYNFKNQYYDFKILESKWK